MTSNGVNSASESKLKKFQGLLRTLFQFDCADLDFGIYRILNYKRQQVEVFITERLPQIVDEAFAHYISIDRETAKRELEELRQRIAENLGPSALDAQGQLQSQFRETPLGKQYQEAQKYLETIQITEELKARVYNDLYNFFSRYYEDGDFIPRRRYGRGEAYTVPYNGEEVVLHWANKDQYYVKSGEHFRTYRFKVGDYTVAFELRDASTEQNNNKGEKKYFVLVKENPIAWDKEAGILTLFFEYRPLTAEEQEQYGKTEQQKPQDKLNEEAVQKVIGCISNPTLKAYLAKPEGDGQPLILKHLTRFTRKNTSDFFIHKDLRGFLLRELDFFIKNEVLLLDELIVGSKQNLDHQVRRARVVRDIGEKIIDFLAQIEDFQKKLWEKKKFVVRTEYCLTIDHLPEELWDEVLANEAQIAEWRQLYSVNGKIDTSYLKTHPTLVVDTRYFSEDFKWRLLACFDNLDEALDGVLIKSENWQALNLLVEKYQEKVKCIYIDPPYNTGSDEFIYKDRYQHSCWLSMMADRLILAKNYMKEDAAIFVSIDDRELNRLRFLMEILFSPWNKVAQCTIKVKDPAGVGQQSIVFDICEYGLVFAKEIEKLRLYAVANPSFDLTEVTEPLQGYRHHILSYGTKVLINEINRPGVGTIRIYKHHNYEIQKAKKLSLEEYVSNAEHIYADYNPSGGMILAIRDQLPERGLSSIEYVPMRGKSSGQPTTIYFLNRRILARASDILVVQEGKVFRRSVLVNLWEVPNATLHTEGGVSLTSGKKPEYLLYRVISAFSSHRDLIFDFFVGSGTSIAVAHKMERKWIGVDAEDNIFLISLERMKRVINGETSGISRQVGWKGGGFFKYHYLEQYEDTLNNLEIPRAAEGQKMLEMFGDEYLLKYMLDFETQGSPSLLNLEMFKNPFAYRLKVQEGDEIVERNVDLVETFNYLLGIDVKKMRAFEKDGRPYRAVLGEKKGRSVVIIWRPVADMEEDNEKLMADKTFIEHTILPTLLGEGVKPHRLLVNGPCYAEDAEAIEPEFKRLMFSGVV